MNTVTEISSTVLGFDFDSESMAKGLRRIEIEITEGMLNQNLLTLTAAKRRGVVKLGEHFRVRLPDGTEFETQLIDPGNKFRERGWIREFYQKDEIESGDYVILQEIESRVWNLSPKPEPSIDVEKTFALPPSEEPQTEGKGRT